MLGQFVTSPAPLALVPPSVLEPMLWSRPRRPGAFWTPVVWVVLVVVLVVLWVVWVALVLRVLVLWVVLVGGAGGGAWLRFHLICLKVAHPHEESTPHLNLLILTRRAIHGLSE